MTVLDEVPRELISSVECIISTGGHHPRCSPAGSPTSALYTTHNIPFFLSFSLPTEWRRCPTGRLPTSSRFKILSEVRESGQSPHMTLALDTHHAEPSL